MVQPRGKENQLGGLVAGIVGTVTEVHSRAAHRPHAAIDGLTHGFRRGSMG
jgi:hypothetical protein